MFHQTPELQKAPATYGHPDGGCFHCGEPCSDGSFALDDKSFCCFGCRTVFSLLQENGLEQFYTLNARPGTRIRPTAGVAKWAFLDDPAVQEKLYDFSDKTRAKVTLHLPAIHCVACVWLLENLFKLHPGIGQSLVNFSRREAAITFAPDKIKFSELAALLASIGYEPEFTFSTLEKPEISPLTKKAWLQIGLAGFSFGNIMLMALPFYFGLDSFSGPWFKNLAGWLSLALALPVVTYSASDFWRAAWLGLRQRALTMEFPVVLGLVAIYAASVFDVISHRGPGYFDTLCALIFFLLCGRLFQRKTHDRLTFDRDYKGFFPLSVVRKTDSGEECVAISRLQTGDRIVLRNGELLPADAKLVCGEACMDYSFVTGESEPVTCAVGSHVFAGGRQVGGAVEVETIKPVTQSYLSSLWNNAAFRKRRDTDLDSLTNRFSKLFTQLVIGIAIMAATFWFFQEPAKSLKVFISVLIVACPCALALAAPLTHGTAQRLLARFGIFLKNAMVIERMAGVDTIVLDKTGTLTNADERSVAIHDGGLSDEEAGWVASLARLSTHPNSIRIARSLGAATLPVQGFKETPGRGIRGEIAGHTILIGSHAWLKENRVAARDHVCLSMAQSGSSVSFAIDGQHRGAFSLENSLRPEVAQLISQLGQRCELALLSGDNEREAARFESIFGRRARLLFNQSPADKLDFIRRLQQRGRKVMMVGDGLNDAGALKQADVGVAVVEQIGVFSPASDVILDAAELPRLAGMLQFARRASWIVRAGFVISAVYNLLGICIAAAGLLSPVVCAILMPLSSVTIVAFTTGATAWMGRSLNVAVPMSREAKRREAQLSSLNPDFLPEEAA